MYTDSRLLFRNLSAQLQQIVASYPSHIQYQRSLESVSVLRPCSESRTASEIFIITRIQLDVLQCNFLLQRLLVSRGFSGGQDLFNTAKETMSVILSLWLDRDRMQSFTHTFDWIVSSNGLLQPFVKENH